MCNFVNNLFTGNNNTLYSNNRMGNRNFHSKLRITIFQINSISLSPLKEFILILDLDIVENYAKDVHERFLENLGTVAR